MEEKRFKIRSYGFGELAQLYNSNIAPKSANEALHRWIRLNRKLNADLIDHGFYPGLRSLTPKMVELIVEAIGEP